MTAGTMPLPRLIRRAELHVERTDIQFFNVAPNRVAIEVAVTNHGSRRSEPTVAVLQAAPLGAFVPWQPLTQLSVPGLDPEESVILNTEATPARPRSLGTPDRVPPSRLLSALGADDAEPPAPSPQARQRRARLRDSALTTPGQSTGQLPADLFELMGRGSALHWAGNLNVFVGGRAVERHNAQALRVYPGHLNLADFIVGSSPDSYRVGLEGTGADWEASLYDAASMSGILRQPSRSNTVPLGEWFPLSGPGMLFLALCPPRDAHRGIVEVHVEQKSTGQTAVVEFELDARAAGPRCLIAE